MPLGLPLFAHRDARYAIADEMGYSCSLAHKSLANCESVRVANVGSCG
jgi:hypothetical protein